MKPVRTPLFLTSSLLLAANIACSEAKHAPPGPPPLSATSAASTVIAPSPNTSSASSTPGAAPRTVSSAVSSTRFVVGIARSGGKPTLPKSTVELGSGGFAAPRIVGGIFEDEASLRAFVPPKHAARIPTIDWSTSYAAFVYAEATNGAIVASPVSFDGGKSVTLRFDFSSHEIALEETQVAILILSRGFDRTTFELYASGRDRMLPRGASSQSIALRGTARTERAVMLEAHRPEPLSASRE